MNRVRPSWGVATSGTDSVARSRLAHAGLPVRDVLISAEIVRHGKPDPAACVVFEDAPSGVAAATAAGAIVVGVLSWAEPGSLDVRYTVKDLRAVEVRANGGALARRTSRSASQNLTSGRTAAPGSALTGASGLW
jgi:beta-phosphoglucomutase-like phosphatase (HAD superfamily)